MVAAALTRAPSLAVVGSGPAAFYTIIRALQKCPDLDVHMFERQCAPFGLARYGVAPDHPEVKNCQERFAEIAGNTNFKFYGNCEVGKDIKLETLAQTFDALLLAYGAGGERKLKIPGEFDTSRVFSARSFVGWYNGEPEFQNLPVQGALARGSRATIIGNGNVALDIARILLKSPEELAKTDITDTAVRALEQSKVDEVNIVGRRGLVHAAFTTKELRELVNEPKAHMLPIVPKADLDIPMTARKERRRNELLAKGKPLSEQKAGTNNKKWQLQFYKSPSEIVKNDSGEVKGIKWSINEYDETGERVIPTGKTVFEPTDVVFKSIGYDIKPLAGLAETGIEFDAQKGVIPRSKGKVISSKFNNIFASGWATTGPVGVIAATMVDSFGVGSEISRYLLDQKKYKEIPANLPINPEKRIITWEDWQKLDAEELRRGEQLGKLRSKFLSVQDAMAWLDSPSKE